MQFAIPTSGGCRQPAGLVISFNPSCQKRPTPSHNATKLDSTERLESEASLAKSQAAVGSLTFSGPIGLRSPGTLETFASRDRPGDRGVGRGPGHKELGFPWGQITESFSKQWREISPRPFKSFFGNKRRIRCFCSNPHWLNIFLCLWCPLTCSQGKPLLEHRAPHPALASPPAF